MQVHYVDVAVITQFRTITTASDLSLPMTVQSHGWVALAPWKWDANAGILSRADLLDTPTTITATQSGPRSIDVRYDRERDAGNALAIESTVRRWLSLDWDPAPAVETARAVDPAVADAIARGGGRFLRGTTFYEDYLKTACTVQINWKGSKRMTARLIQQIGDGFVPTPVQIIDAGELVLRQQAGLGFRAKGILLSTERLLESGLIDERGDAREDALTYDTLIQLHGVGPYAASHLRVLLHDFSRVPIDSEVAAYFRNQHGIDPASIDRSLDAWGQYRFLGYRLSRRLSR